MPKERKVRSVSNDKHRGSSPLCCDSSFALKQSQAKEWEEARCPVCMEHPHNGVLLICSSYENGCRPYMCDTSHRHSNCFDQFQKACKDTPSLSLPIETEAVVSLGSRVVNVREEEASSYERREEKLTCPLCRGSIKEWVVVEEARSFMNSKHRSCSTETCDFVGSYKELRKHARLQHPEVRPTEADPERQRRWRRLEWQRELGDLLSSVRASYGSDDEEEIVSFDNSDWLRVRLLYRVFRPAVRSRGSGGSNSRSGASRARSRVAVRRRRRSPRLWGERSYEGDTRRSEEEVYQFSDEQQESRTQRRRARRRTFIVHVDDDDDDVEES